jgi:hypothetical protein
MRLEFSDSELAPRHGLTADQSGRLIVPPAAPELQHSRGFHSKHVFDGADAEPNRVTLCRMQFKGPTNSLRQKETAWPTN